MGYMMVCLIIVPFIIGLSLGFLYKKHHDRQKRLMMEIQEIFDKHKGE